MFMYLLVNQIHGSYLNSIPLKVTKGQVGLPEIAGMSWNANDSLQGCLGDIMHLKPGVYMRVYPAHLIPRRSQHSLTDRVNGNACFGL